MSEETATIDEFPGYTFYRDGRATNRYGQFIGSVSKDDGYVNTSFNHKNGKRHKKRLHIMILWAFSGEPQNGRDVDHINGKRDDNRYENLQYLDRKSHNLKTRKDNPEVRICRSREIECINKNGNITKFISMTEASEFLFPNINRRTGYDKIINSINNNLLCNGYKLSFIENKLLDGEIWKNPDIDGLESNIEVSNFGRVKKLNKIKDNYKQNNSRYILIIVKIKGRNIGKGLHTLICSAFHGKQPDWATSVNHIDENPLNNNADNLEWSNASKQADSWRCKIHLEKDGKIEHTFNSIKETNEFLNLSYGINNCLTGKSKKVKGYTVIRDCESKRKIKDIGKKNKSGIEIYQLDDNKNIIKEYPNICAGIREVLPELDINKYPSKCGSIRQAMICKYKCMGYYWQYKNPPENIDELREKMIAKSNENNRKRRERIRNASVNV